MPPKHHIAACWLFAIANGAALAQQETSRPSLADLTLEQLTSIVVTSVGKRAQRLADVAGSVYVIRADDIRRSGATSLPEALRLAPNLQVARAEATQYAITARTGADLLANKMLVLVDGRTVYSPLFSGVFWEALDVMLEDIDRIEVLSGAGGTLYGSNAFHGVINIITKPASETTGTLVAAGVGNRRRSAAARFGSANEHSSWRVYARKTHEEATETAAGTQLRDAGRHAQAGFRVDRAAGAGQLTVQGDLFERRIEDPLGHRRYEGGNLLARFVSEQQGHRDQLQLYLDRFMRDRSQVIRDTMDTFDIEFQRQSRPRAGHELLWGAGWRRHDDQATNYMPAAVALLPAERRLHLWNVFVQDEIAVSPRLKLTAGLKAEHNTYTGLEWLPTLRAAWTPAPEHLVWGGASRVVRAPARVDREVYSAPVLNPSPGFVSEIAEVYEVGYRGQVTPRLSMSATLFHHRFDRLRSLDPGPGGPTFNNNHDGRLSGIEGWGEWRPSDNWRLRAGYMRQHVKYRLAATTTPILPATTLLGNDARSQFQLGLAWDVGNNMELDVELRRVGERPLPQVPAYVAIDGRWGWRPAADLELSLVVRNMNRRRHLEWATAALRAEVERSVLLQAVWRH